MMDDREDRLRKNFESSLAPDLVKEGVELMRSMEYRPPYDDPAEREKLREWYKSMYGNPRPSERIPRILAKIQAIWERYPDFRFGQLLANLFPKYESNLFHPEDDRLEKALDEFQGF